MNNHSILQHPSCVLFNECIAEVVLRPLQYLSTCEHPSPHRPAATKTKGSGKRGRPPGRKGLAAAADDGGAASGPDAPSSSGASGATGGAAGGEASTENLVSKLGSQRVNNIFTHLRKIAQHPLLVRPLLPAAGRRLWPVAVLRDFDHVAPPTRMLRICVPVRRFATENRRSSHTRQPGCPARMRTILGTDATAYAASLTTSHHTPARAAGSPPL